MICVSLKETNPEKLLRILKKIEFAEIRLDSMTVDMASVRDMFSQHLNLIATCRPGLRKDMDRKTLLLTAVKAGAAYVDIEVESDDVFKDALVQESRRQGCKVIVSYHNFSRTPDRAELDKIVSWCFESGADIAKIACQVRSKRDNAQILGLLSDPRPLVVCGMGSIGKITRIVGPSLGSRFTYASLEEGEETAEGQISKTQLEQILMRIEDV